jgi:hypothetical protein
MRQLEFLDLQKNPNIGNEVLEALHREKERFPEGGLLLDPLPGEAANR